MDRKEILDRVQARFQAKVTDIDLECLEPHFFVAPADWPEIALFLRDACEIDHLSCLTSVDRGDGLEAIYTMEHMGADRQPLSVRIRVPYDEPHIPSVESVWRTADWHEREAFDLMGLQFTGHPNLRRILCAEDWEGHPLRKDYESPDRYHGVKNNVV